MTYNISDSPESSDDLEEADRCFLILGAIYVIALAVASGMAPLMMFSTSRRSSKTLFKQMFACVLGAPITFFESNPLGKCDHSPTCLTSSVVDWQKVYMHHNYISCSAVMINYVAACSSYVVPKVTVWQSFKLLPHVAPCYKVNIVNNWGCLFHYVP